MSLRLGADAADATDYLADTGIARAVLDTIDPADRDRGHRRRDRGARGARRR